MISSKVLIIAIGCAGLAMVLNPWKSRDRVSSGSTVECLMSMGEWSPGQKVRHPQHGEGQVVEVDPKVGDAPGFVRVDFPGSNGSTRTNWATQDGLKQNGWSDQ